MQNSLKYKPVLNHPYVITRILKNKDFTPWSTPKELDNVKPTDLQTLNKVKEQLEKPDNDPEDSSKICLKLNFRLWNYSFGSFPREKTEVRLCLPAGTIFAAIKV